MSLRIATIAHMAGLMLVIACTSSQKPADAPASASASTPPSAPTLILLSLDGFRWDYPEKMNTPHLDRMAARGVVAKALIPPFPSKTFPSLYTIVTGLHPGHHGIISNYMRDPDIEHEFRPSNKQAMGDTRWWQGEPIWVTAERQGVRSAVLFWVGSEAPIDGVRPTEWTPFNRALPYEERIDRLLSWLERPALKRPGLILGYLGEPNHTGHRQGPLAPETVAAAEHVDGMVGRLLDGLDERGLADRVNLVVVSDHGMAANSTERVVIIDQLADIRTDEVFQQGAFVQIFTDSDERTEHLYAQLHGAHEHMQVYRRQDIPARFVLDHPRVPPLIGVPDVGWTVVTQAIVDRFGGRVIPGDHGQDPSHPDMHGIFYAAGPSFRQATQVPALNAVDVYHVLARALQLDPADNDGDPRRARTVLREQSQSRHELAERRPL